MCVSAKILYYGGWVCTQGGVVSIYQLVSTGNNTKCKTHKISNTKTMRTTPTQNVYLTLISHARQRENLGLRWVGVCAGGGGVKIFIFNISIINIESCKPCAECAGRGGFFRMCISRHLLTLSPRRQWCEENGSNNKNYFYY